MNPPRVFKNKHRREIAFTSKAIERDSIKKVFGLKAIIVFCEKNEVISLSLFIKLEYADNKNFIHK